MLNAPQTLEQARQYRYNQQFTSPEGIAYQPGQCAYEMFDNITDELRQCKREANAGPGDLYCGRHAKMLEKYNANPY